MKRFNLFFIIGFMLCCCLNVFPQATSLIIDNQAPGWLSSKIGYGDQQTVENLKITGYLNISDLQFIAQLMREHSLHGRLDMEDANIVGETPNKDNYLVNQGDIFGSYNNNASGAYEYQLKYFSYPKTLIGGDQYALSSLHIDTLFINTETDFTGALLATVKHIRIGGKVTILKYPSFSDVGPYSNSPEIESIEFPPTLKEICETWNSSLSENEITCTIANGNNLKTFPSLERLVANFKVKEMPDSVFLPNIIILSLNQYHDYHSSSMFKKGMHVFIGKKIEKVTDMSDAYGINLHFESPTPPVLEGSIVYHYQLDNSQYYKLYVPNGSADAYRACFKDGGTKVTIIEETIDVSDILLDKHDMNLNVNDTYSLSVSISPKRATDKSVNWVSDHPEIVEVNLMGLVSAKKAGKAKITVSSVSNPDVYDICEITVIQPATNIQINETSLSMTQNSGTKQLTATIKPDDTTDKTVLWSSSNTNVAVVDAYGLVSAKKAGECTITATAASNPEVKATCQVTVIQPATGIKLSPESFQLADIGQGIQLEATVLPADATNKQVKWRSIDENVCTVSQSGYVLAVGFGSTTIIATTEDGGFSATCSITVMKPSYTITYMVDGVPYRSYEIKVGEGIAPVAEPEKEGYTFSGWSEIPSTMPAHDLTITGSFSVNSYTLLYMVNGEEYKQLSVKFGTALTPEAAPTREGYTFSGWSEVPETMPAHDLTITGSFTINSYKLTYMVDGKVYKEYNVEYGSMITPEAEPTKDYYTFSGWSGLPDTMPANDVIVTGEFTINKYKLTYTVDGVEYKSFMIEYGTSVTPEEEPIKEGYTFSGWLGVPTTMPAKDVTVTGSFSVNSYTLIYLVDGEEYKTITVKYGSALTPESKPTKEGYTFSGWNEVPATMPAHDVTITGSFTINSYTVTYMVDGKEYKVLSVKYGTLLTKEAEPEREGYTFSGWSEIPSSMPAHDVIVIGTFTVNQYKLTYMVDGIEYKSYNVKFGEVIKPEAEPSKEGYTFSSWSDIPTTMPAHDVTVNGYFSIGEYKLTYMIDGEVYKTLRYNYESHIEVEPFPEKEGYTFSGWSEIPETMPAHDVTIMGSYSVNSYILRYLVDGEEYKTSSVNYGTVLTPEAEPKKEGYTFSGWSEIPATMPAMDVTVTGTFAINSYKLTYMVDGIEYKSFKVKFGETITPEKEPAKEGYSFSGWSGIPTTMPAHDVTVTGSFSKGQYKVTYIVDGEIYKVIRYDYDASITSESIPEKEGYTFSGWSEIPETMPAYDVVVSGSFTINSYVITYMVDGKEYTKSTVVYGTTLNREEEPTKEGHTFSGWSEAPATMPAHDVVVTGYFTINSYTLTYLVDEKEYKSSSVKYGTALIAESNPEKEGYSFSGWSEIPATMPAHDVTVTGAFVINSYHLTYMVDGQQYKMMYVEYGAALTLEAEPEKEGYTFSGWSSIPATMPAQDVTVRGTFTINSYTITYMMDGDVYRTETINYGATITPPEAPKKEGYTFGWSEVPTTMPAHDVTVTGTFTVNSYTLLYMVDGEEYKTASVEYGTELTAEGYPEKEGYSFSGWSEVPERMPAHDVTVTGSFVINQYSITYLYEGEVLQTVTLDYQAEVVAPAFPLVVEGYTFVWDGLPERMPAHDVTVTGGFQVNQYSITYVVDGEVVDTQQVDYGSEITPPAVADKEGYTFGWDAYPPTMPAHDLTITGSYLTGIRSLKGGLAVQQIYTVDGKRVTKVGRGVHMVRQGKQIIKIVK